MNGWRDYMEALQGSKWTFQEAVLLAHRSLPESI